MSYIVNIIYVAIILSAKARILRENGRFLPANGFAMRKYFLNDEEHCYLLKRVAKQTSQPNVLDPSMITDMLKVSIDRY